MTKELLKTAQVCFLKKKLILLFLILIKFESIFLVLNNRGPVRLSLFLDMLQQALSYKFNYSWTLKFHLVNKTKKTNDSLWNSFKSKIWALMG